MVDNMLLMPVLYCRIETDGTQLEMEPVVTQLNIEEVKTSPQSSSPELDSITEDAESSISSLKGHRK